MSPMLSTAVVSDESHHLTDYVSDLACVEAILYVYALKYQDLYGRSFQRSLRNSTDFERIWHIQDSQGKNTALAFGLKSLLHFKLSPFRSEAVGDAMKVLQVVPQL